MSLTASVIDRSGLGVSFSVFFVGRRTLCQLNTSVSLCVYMGAAEFNVGVNPDLLFVIAAFSQSPMCHKMR